MPWDLLFLLVLPSFFLYHHTVLSFAPAPHLIQLLCCYGQARGCIIFFFWWYEQLLNFLYFFYSPTSSETAHISPTGSWTPAMLLPYCIYWLHFLRGGFLSAFHNLVIKLPPQHFVACSAALRPHMHSLSLLFVYHLPTWLIQTIECHFLGEFPIALYNWQRYGYFCWGQW